MTARQCIARNRRGERCGRKAIPGATVCRYHGGAAPQVQRAAARRLAEEQAQASIADVVVEPIDNPLDKLAELAAEAWALKGQLAAMVAELGTDFADDGGEGPWANGEQVRVVVQLFERAMDRCQKYLADWVRLGFEERKARLDDARAQLVQVAIAGVLAELGLQLEAPGVRGVLERWLPVLDGAPPPAPIELTASELEDDET